MTETRDAVADLRQIAFLLERANEATYRVRAFRKAAAAVAALPAAELLNRATARTLTELAGVGAVTAQCVAESLAGQVPGYLAKLLTTAAGPVTAGGEALRQALRGDCHTHSDWSDGGSPIREMAEAARDLGHEYIVLTDHSPRLTVANGLTADRLRHQLDVVAELNAELAPFRILTGIEVDILDDGRLDQEPDLLARLDLVVASVHSGLRMPAEDMTRRMVVAIANPNTDVLGHCTGRMVTGNRKRPESQFDAELGVRRLRPVRRGGRGEQPAGAAGPAQAAAAAGGRVRLPVHRRHRRARPGSARLAAVRLRAGRRVRRPGRPGDQHRRRRGRARLDRPARLTLGGTPRPAR